MFATAAALPRRFLRPRALLRALPRQNHPQQHQQQVRAFAKGSPTSVSLHETREEGSAYVVQGTSGRHTLSADLMPQAGGKDKGPSPKEYLLVALGSCTLMTMRIYSDAMINGGKWPGKLIKKMEVEVSEQGEDHHLPLSLQVKVTLHSNLDEEQVTRLLAAASKCPVKRMLGGGLKDGITTVLVR